MEINVPLLKQICEIAGAPGFEKRVRDLVIELVAPLVDEVNTDNLGSVIAIKKRQTKSRWKTSDGSSPLG